MLSRALTRQLLQRSQEAFRTSSCAIATSTRFQHTQASEEEDTAEFRELVREFAAREVAPHAADIDRNNALPTHKNLWTEMGHMGLHGEDDPVVTRLLSLSPLSPLSRKDIQPHILALDAVPMRILCRDHRACRLRRP